MTRVGAQPHGKRVQLAPTASLAGRPHLIDARSPLLSRVRRAVVLAVRAAVIGDVPFGLFWFGWGETPWTPSGYQGWTSDKKPTLLQRLRFGAAPPQKSGELVVLVPRTSLRAAALQTKRAA